VFTGGQAAGRSVLANAARNLVPVTLELGGKSPVIVLEDADPVQAAAGAANAIFFNQGQVCTAGSRLYVQRKAFDRVVSELAAIASKMKLGPGLDPASEIGPLVSDVQRDRVCEYIAHGVGQGAKVAAGGDRTGERGYFVQPTVLTDARQDMRVVQEESFGPVVVALPFDDVDEAVRLANDTMYGLGASIWSNDLACVHRLIPRIKAGTVWVNCHSMLDSSLPFGGFKQSGIGREMGRAALDLFTDTKSVLRAV
jgi:phenylacetaldehyde dehydrogenase